VIGHSAHRWYRANWLALLLPVALLVGAWGSQLIGGLYPCEMCHWQRWPHYAAVVLAGIGLVQPSLRRPMVVLAALAIMLSGLIGVAHAGVEYHWWQGFTACTSTVSASGGSAADRLAAIMKAPMVRCDQAQWTLFGISLAGFNAIFSLGGAITILSLVRRAR
jgi:disulfide bond formation protein DsbB